MHLAVGTRECCPIEDVNRHLDTQARADRLVAQKLGVDGRGRPGHVAFQQGLSQGPGLFKAYTAMAVLASKLSEAALGRRVM